MPFTEATTKFLRQLQKNNRRDWFEKHKLNYETDVRGPALDFISQVAPGLKKISPYFQAIARKNRGSLMRVYRDIRFSKDKTPYKTNIGIHFRHEFGKDVHAPGYYVHLAPNESYVGVGIWRPDSATLKKIRTRMADESELWKKAIGSKAFRVTYRLAGDSLKKAPLGFETDHPLIEDLRRKDLVGVRHFEISDATKNDFSTQVIGQFKKANSFMRFLCDTLHIPF